MKNKLLLFPLLAAFIILFSNMNCKKDKPQPPPFVHQIDPVFLSYFAFPKGSWWTYKEINSHERDSFYVRKHDFDIITQKGSDFTYQRLNYVLVSMYDSAYGFADIYINLHDTIFRYTEMYYGGPEGYNYDAERLFYPMVPGAKFPENFSNLYIYECHDSLMVGGILYYDVVQTYNYTSEYYNRIQSEYYCRNVGVIRREYFDGKIWELDKFKLNK